LVKLESEQNVLRVTFELDLLVRKPLDVEARFADNLGNCLAVFSPGHERGESPSLPPGLSVIEHLIHLPKRMNRGEYLLTLYLTHHNVVGYGEVRDIRVCVDGVPTRTGRVLDYSSSSGWLFLE
jgi:hypothetical protein